MFLTILGSFRSYGNPLMPGSMTVNLHNLFQLALHASSVNLLLGLPTLLLRKSHMWQSGLMLVYLIGSLGLAIGILLNLATVATACRWLKALIFSSSLPPLRIQLFRLLS